jgi:RNA polymerase sigma-70 factor (ECF subfamily)
MDQSENDRDDVWAVSRTLRGERDAFAEIVRRYQGPIFRLMLRFTRDEHSASEMAQDAFVRAFERLSSYNPKLRFFTWLYTLALNLARDHARRIAREPKDYRSVDLVSGDARNDPVASLEAVRLLDVLRRMSPKYGEVLALRYIEDMSLGDVAEMTGLSMSGVKMRVHRALRLLREHYKEDE